LEHPLQPASGPGDTAALGQQIKALEQQIAALRARFGGGDDAGEGAADSGRSTGQNRMSRRTLLTAAAGAAAGLVAGQAAPARAADGDPLLLGRDDNAAASTTRINMTGVFPPIGFQVFSPRNAIHGKTTDSGWAVLGELDVGPGHGGPAGVWGIANGGFQPRGVQGTSGSPGGRGVFGRGVSYGVHGESFSTTGRGVFGDAGASSGDARGVYGRSKSTAGIGVYGEDIATSGINYGVWGRSYSPSGKGVFGDAPSSSGATYGVHGRSVSTGGTGVYGQATAISGTTAGVVGQAVSPAGYGVVSLGRFKATGRSYLATPNSPPVDPDLSNGMVSFYLDEATNKLKVRVRYSSGVYRTGSVNLS